jgi:phosphoenolpyruvate---glycerone phosphotransferase subunit DhaM
VTAPTGTGPTTARVALLLVSHSSTLADGAAELAAQMAPNVLLVAAGGLEDGSLGTSFDLIGAGLVAATHDGRSVVVLTDLGSAVLTTESVLEFAGEEVSAHVRLADAPFVEGAVAAAVAAAGGADLDAVLAAAELAGASFGAAAGSAATAPVVAPTAAASEGTAVHATAVLRNPLGLHARPAAQLARSAARFEAAVTVNGVDAASVLAVMGLGAVGGQTVTVTAAGPQASAALVAVIDEIEAGFGEA